MKHTKRLLSLVMCVAMIFSTLAYKAKDVQAATLSSEEIASIADASKNLALGKIAEVYPGCAEGNIPNMTNGNLGGGHCALSSGWGYSGEAYAVIDLGDYYDASSLDKMIVKYKDAATNDTVMGRTYSIQYSADNSEWTTVYESAKITAADFASDNAIVDDLSGYTGAVRFIKIDYPSLPTYGIQIREWAIIANNPQLAQIAKPSDAADVAVSSDEIGQVKYTVEAGANQDGYAYNVYIGEDIVGENVEAGQEYTVTGIKGGEQTVKVYSVYNGILSDGLEKTVNVKAYATYIKKDENIAYGKNFSLDCGKSAEGNGSLTDGTISHTSYVTTTKSQPGSWAQIDLGNVYEGSGIDNVVIWYRDPNAGTWEGNGGLKLQYSSNGSTFEDVATISAKQFAAIDKSDVPFYLNIDLSEIKASAPDVQFIRVLYPKAVPYGAQMTEIGVYDLDGDLAIASGEGVNPPASVTASGDVDVITGTIVAGENQEDYLYNVYVDGELVKSDVAAGDFTINNVTAGTHTVSVASKVGNKVSTMVSVENVVVTTSYTVDVKGNVNAAFADADPVFGYNYVRYEGVSATESSAVNDGSKGDKAIDNNVNTRWESTQQDPNYMTVDLKNKYTISQLKIDWETASAKVYKVEVSDNGKDFEEVASVNSNVTQRTDTITFNKEVKGRFVRIYGTERTTVYGYSIFEMAIYGPDAEIAPIILKAQKKAFIYNATDSGKGYRVEFDDSANTGDKGAIKLDELTDEESYKYIVTVNGKEYTVSASGKYIDLSDAGLTDGQTYTATIKSVYTDANGIEEASPVTTTSRFVYTDGPVDPYDTGIASVHVRTSRTDSTNGLNIFKDETKTKVDSAITVKNGDKSLNVAGIGQINVRGNSTKSAQKKPYNIKFTEKLNVLGMGKAKKWCLLANCFDKTLIRNQVGYYFHNQLEKTQSSGNVYSSLAKPVDLYIDGYYVGEYLLAEAVETGSTRVNIDEENLDKLDILLELDATGRDRASDSHLLVTSKDEDGNVVFDNNDGKPTTAAHYRSKHYGQEFTVNEPGTDGTANMEEYGPWIEKYSDKMTAVENFIDEFEDAVYAKDYARVCELADMESFVDFYITSELFKTKDIGFSSTRFYLKEVDGTTKIYGGPLWDMDLSSGNAENNEGYTDPYAKNENKWFGALMEIPEFRAQVATRWQEQLPLIHSVVDEGGVIDQMIDEVSLAAALNYSVAHNVFSSADNDYNNGWDVTALYGASQNLGENVYGSRILHDTYEEYLADFKAWMQNREVWMSNYLGVIEIPEPTEEPTTEEATEAPTEAATEVATEAPTEAATEAVTEAPTEATTAAAPLNQPVGLTYAGNDYLPFYFAWAPVAEATAYNVYINDEYVTTVTIQNVNFDPALFSEAGTYTISIEATDGTRVSPKASVDYVVKATATTVEETTEEETTPSVAYTWVKLEGGVGQYNQKKDKDGNEVYISDNAIDTEGKFFKKTDIFGLYDTGAHVPYINGNNTVAGANLAFAITSSNNGHVTKVTVDGVDYTNGEKVFFAGDQLVLSQDLFALAENEIEKTTVVTISGRETNTFAVKVVNPEVFTMAKLKSAHIFNAVNADKGYQVTFSDPNSFASKIGDDESYTYYLQLEGREFEIAKSGDYIDLSDMDLTVGSTYRGAIYAKYVNANNETFKTELVKTSTFTYTEDADSAYDTGIGQVFIRTSRTDSTNGVDIFRDETKIKFDSEIVVKGANGKIECADFGSANVRGNSTKSAQKKAYNIKFNSKQNVFKMGKAKKWCLLANCFDKTLIRNQAAFYLYNQLEQTHSSGHAYTGLCKPVDLYIDGYYVGEYLLTEAVEAGSTRVAIDSENTENTDILLEIDDQGRDRASDAHLVKDIAYDEDGNVESFGYYESALGMQFAVNDPGEDGEVNMPAFKDWMKTYDAKIARTEAFIDDFEAAVIAKDYDTVSQLADMESFVDFYIVSELFKTKDIGFSSTRYYIQGDADGNNKLYAGPLWDLDLSSGNAENNEGYTDPYAKDQNKWFRALMAIPEFQAAVAARWEELLPVVHQLVDDGGAIDEIYAQVLPSATLNYSVAHNVFSSAENDYNNGWDVKALYGASQNLGENVYGSRIVYNTYEEYVAVFKTWMQNRTMWMSQYLGVNEETEVTPTEEPTTVEATTVEETTEEATTVEETTEEATTVEETTEEATTVEETTEEPTTVEETTVEETTEEETTEAPLTFEYEKAGKLTQNFPAEDAQYGTNYLTFEGVSATATTGNAASAIDGKINTRWESVHGVDPQTITINLGNVYGVNRLAIFWEAANAKDFTVSVSTNGVDYTEVADLTNIVSGDRTDYITFSKAVQAQYIKIHGTARNLVYGYSIWEMAVYGNDSFKEPFTLAALKKAYVYNTVNAMTSKKPENTGYQVVFSDSNKVTVAEGETYNYVFSVAGQSFELAASGDYVDLSQAGLNDGQTYTGTVCAKFTDANGKVTTSVPVATSTFAYTEAADEVNMSGIGAVYIRTSRTDSTAGLDIFRDETKTKVDSEIVVKTAAGDLDCADFGTFNVRGNSTKSAQKKAYNIKFNSKQNVYKMGKAKKWCLLANCFDKTLIRNQVAFAFQNALEKTQSSGNVYSSLAKPVELYIDGKYVGEYLLTEAVEAGSTRVDIDSDNTENTDILLEIDDQGRDRASDAHLVKNIAYDAEGNVASYDYYESALGMQFAVNEPGEDGEVNMPAFKEWMKTNEAKITRAEAFLDEFEAAVIAKDYATLSQLADMESFVDFYITAELFKTKDIGFSSTRYYIKGDAEGNNKLYAGPLWDLDLSSGNANNNEGYTDPYARNENKWFRALMNIPEFRDAVAARWEEVLPIVHDLVDEGGIIDQAIDEIAVAAARNYSVAYNVFSSAENGYNNGWDVSGLYGASQVLGQNVYGSTIVHNSYEEYVDDFKTWMKNRKNWMDTYLGVLDTNKPVYLQLVNDQVEINWNDDAEDATYEITFKPYGQDETTVTATGDKYVLDNVYLENQSTVTVKRIDGDDKVLVGSEKALADLAVIDITTVNETLVAGQTIRVKGIVKNIGTAVAVVTDNKRITSTLTVDGSWKGYTDGYVGPAYPGETVTNYQFVSNWNGNQVTAGTHTFKVMIDERLLVEEANEANNTMEKDFVVEAN